MKQYFLLLTITAVLSLFGCRETPANQGGEDAAKTEAAPAAETPAVDTMAIQNDTIKEQ